MNKRRIAKDRTGKTMAEAVFEVCGAHNNGNDGIETNESLPYRIVSQSVERFLGYMGKSVCRRMNLSLHFGSVWQKMEIAR
jgi:hypothetical protein